ncbi:MAG: DUF7009 family protein [Flavobacteriales bacterium]
MNWRIADDGLRVRLNALDVHELNTRGELQVGWHIQNSEMVTFRLYLRAIEEFALDVGSNGWTLAWPKDAWDQMPKSPGSSTTLEKHNKLNNSRLCVVLEVDLKH